MSSRASKTVSVRQVAELLGISRNHAFRCIQREEIPAILIGRRFLCPFPRLAGLLSVTQARRAHLQQRAA